MIETMQGMEVIQGDEGSEWTVHIQKYDDWIIGLGRLLKRVLRHGQNTV